MLIDATRMVRGRLKGKLPTGVDRVDIEYVRHFRARALAVLRLGPVWVTLPAERSDRLFGHLLEPEEECAQSLRMVLTRCCAAARLGLPHGDGIFLNSGHNGLERPDYSAKLRRSGTRPLFFVHDLIPDTHPEYCRPGDAEKHRRRLAAMLSLARGLAVNSEHTRQTLVEHARRRGCSVPTCVVAPLAPARLPPPIGDPPLAHPYFVVLGTIESRKNHLLLLNMWRSLVNEFGPAAPRLAIIGQPGWECEQALDMLERCEVLRGYVLKLPRCDDTQLALWLHHARALLIPSFVEGYGLPVVEALAAGVPVIASRLPVFRDIAGDIPEYLDPTDGLGWREAILDYTTPYSPSRRMQLRRLEAFRAPTWDEHFMRLDDLIARIMAENRRTQPLRGPQRRDREGVFAARRHI